jgi:hypothetical protein
MQYVGSQTSRAAGCLKTSQYRRVQPAGIALASPVRLEWSLAQRGYRDLCQRRKLRLHERRMGSASISVVDGVLGSRSCTDESGLRVDEVSDCIKAGRNEVQFTAHR